MQRKGEVRFFLFGHDRNLDIYKNMSIKTVVFIAQFTRMFEVMVSSMILTHNPYCDLTALLVAHVTTVSTAT